MGTNGYNAGIGTAYLFRGAGDGTFGSPSSTNLQQYSYAHDAEDMDGDGDLDVTLGSVSPKVGVLFNDGWGRFVQGPRYPVELLLSRQLGRTVTADLDDDGDQDIAIPGQTAEGEGSLAVLRNDSRGRFSPPSYYPIAGPLFGSPASEPADVTGDGALDVVIGNVDPSGGVVVVPGDGTGSFRTAVRLATPTGTNGSAFVGDYDLDGDADVASVGPTGVAVHLADGAGGFEPVTTYALDSPTPVRTLADVNTDGVLDVVVTVHEGQSFVLDRLSVSLGDGTGGFLAPSTYAAGGAIRDVNVAKVTGDGKPDVVLLYSGLPHYSVMVQGGPSAVTQLVVGGPADCGPVRLVERQTLECTVDVRNDGPDAAREVRLNLDLGDQVARITSASGAGLTCRPVAGPDPDHECVAAEVPAGWTSTVSMSIQVATFLPHIYDRLYIDATLTTSTGEPIWDDNRTVAEVRQSRCTIDASRASSGQTIVGTAGDDVICGSAFNDVIHGGGGDDRIYAMGGKNAVYGDDGNDALYGQADDDYLNGGNGADILYGAAGRDALAGGNGTDRCDAGPPPNAAIRSCP